MECAGSEDTDPDAERKGLAIPATRAAVIEKLVKGGLCGAKRESSYFPQKTVSTLCASCRTP